MDEYQPWVTCFLSQIMVTYLEKSFPGCKIDYPKLFHTAQGFKPPLQPESFLKDGNNWIPLPVLRSLMSECERLTGCKDVAYRAARAFFAPGESRIPSLFAIIVRALDDVRSSLICSTVWGAVQTNYLKLQSFERDDRNLCMLAQFREDALPSLGTIHLLRGIAEGFPRLYSFVESSTCIEEMSQVRIEDIVAEFPGYRVESGEDHLKIRLQGVHAPVVEAARVPLETETVAVSPEFLTGPPDAMVAVPLGGWIEVLTGREESNPQKRAGARRAYRIAVRARFAMEIYATHLSGTGSMTPHIPGSVCLTPRRRRSGPWPASRASGGRSQTSCSST